MSILTVQHLEKHFNNTKVLNDISFSLEQGQALSIIGSSGSGKTTLLRCLNFLETPDTGTITVQNEVLFDASDRQAQSEAEIRKKRLHFGMVFQSFNLFPQYTALENVTLARELMAKNNGESHGDRGHEAAGDVLLQCAEGIPGLFCFAGIENSFGFGLLEETACNDGCGGRVDPGQREV